MKWMFFLGAMLSASGAFAQAPSELEAREAAERYLRREIAAGTCADYCRFVRVVGVAVAAAPVDDAYPTRVTFEIVLASGPRLPQDDGCVPGKLAHAGPDMREYRTVLRLGRGVGVRQT